MTCGKKRVLVSSWIVVGFPELCWKRTEAQRRRTKMEFLLTTLKSCWGWKKYGKSGIKVSWGTHPICPPSMKQNLSLKPYSGTECSYIFSLRVGVRISRIHQWCWYHLFGVERRKSYAFCELNKTSLKSHAISGRLIIYAMFVDLGLVNFDWGIPSYCPTQSSHHRDFESNED